MVRKPSSRCYEQTLKPCSHRATPSRQRHRQTLRWQTKWVCNLFFPPQFPSKRSKVPPVIVTLWRSVRMSLKALFTHNVCFCISVKCQVWVNSPLPKCWAKNHQKTNKVPLPRVTNNIQVNSLKTGCLAKSYFLNECWSGVQAVYSISSILHFRSFK